MVCASPIPIHELNYATSTEHLFPLALKLEEKSGEDEFSDGLLLGKDEELYSCNIQGHNELVNNITLIVFMKYRQWKVDKG
jgi:hypothetical protein